MKHLVLFRFESHFLTPNLMQEADRVLHELKMALPQDILNTTVRKNCVQRDANYDLLMELELSSESSLEKYLQHPIHMALVKEWSPHITGRVSFDY